MKRNHYEYLKKFDLVKEADDREPAIKLCGPIEIKFTEYFHKIYSTKDFSLIIKMQNLFNEAINIRMKVTKNIISDEDLMDYFFHADNQYEKLMKDNQKEIDDYEKYCILLLENRNDFYNITKEFFEVFI